MESSWLRISKNVFNNHSVQQYRENIGTVYLFFEMVFWRILSNCHCKIKLYFLLAFTAVLCTLGKTNRFFSVKPIGNKTWFYTVKTTKTTIQIPIQNAKPHKVRTSHTLRESGGRTQVLGGMYTVRWASIWKLIVNHFSNSKTRILFLQAPFGVDRQDFYPWPPP